ncbi:MAG: HRDC domain-containing protein [Acidobacteriota bacterium]|nr:HRDC domain-containing protein [Acidobacteriota bacterium]
MSWIEQTGRITWRYVDTEAQLREAAEALGGERLVGLDTETFWDVKTGGQQLALVQIAPPAGDVLVADVLATGVEPLRPLLESPETKMVAHNARFDEGVLRGAGLRAEGLIDTLRMSRMALTLASHSLASLSEHLFGLPIDKSLQKSNWRRRPLTRAQIEYAALDARMALLVYGELSRMLAEEGRLDLALRLSEVAPAEPKEPGAEPKKKRKPAGPELILTPEEKRVVKALKSWRLNLANTQRVPAYMICHDRTLEHLARTRPETLEALAQIYGLGESKIKKFGEEMLRALRESCG